ncbi:phytanoyl-CoA dioxygenase family protein [Actinomadura rubrisoli]|uniref:Phytanoyl-CoA dioxygenase family protein n=1 Tax=Actinomadura rubrisoli TaxID=2530368 RepID=A0A4R4ZWF5_9ACTN|nr:phytanoyl-CoA dioxygenase family protein [Actinomadura rubrisoli]TDD63541.1 hypothetical protein E1298_43770 [Actinomadura rubrisoli]
MNSTDLRSHFAEHGFVRLAQGFAPEVASALARDLWGELERRHGIRREDRSTWTVTEPRGLGALSRRGVFDTMAAPAVTAAISELVGYEDWARPAVWGTPLVTFPRRAAWDVPAGGWHIDYPLRGAAGAALALKWLAYLVPVAEQGGGTVVLSGSHRLAAKFLREAAAAEPGRSPTVRDAIFGSHSWLRGIRRPGEPGERARRLMEDGATVSGIALRVVELTGRPGDVVFMHPHLFHAAAPNSSSSPRFMVTGGLITPTGDVGPERPDTARSAANPS